MTKHEYRAAYREARKIAGFWRAVKSKLPEGSVLSLAMVPPMEAMGPALSRGGDWLRYSQRKTPPAFRINRLELDFSRPRLPA